MLISRFIVKSIKDETISEYKAKGDALIRELMEFARGFKDDPEEEGVMERVKRVSGKKEVAEGEIEEVEKEVERVLKMFYLQMRVQGKLKEFKEDYFQ